MADLQSGNADAHAKPEYVLDLTALEFHVYRGLVRMYQFSRETTFFKIAHSVKKVGLSEGFGLITQRRMSAVLKSLARKNYIKIKGRDDPLYIPLFDMNGKQLEPLLSEFDKELDVPVFKCPSGYPIGYGLANEKE